MDEQQTNTNEEQTEPTGDGIVEEETIPTDSVHEETTIVPTDNVNEDETIPTNNTNENVTTDVLPQDVTNNDEEVIINLDELNQEETTITDTNDTDQTVINDDIDQETVTGDTTNSENVTEENVTDQTVVDETNKEETVVDDVTEETDQGLQIEDFIAQIQSLINELISTIQNGQAPTGELFKVAFAIQSELISTTFIENNQEVVKSYSAADIYFIFEGIKNDIKLAVDKLREEIKNNNVQLNEDLFGQLDNVKMLIEKLAGDDTKAVDDVIDTFAEVKKALAGYKEEFNVFQLINNLKEEIATMKRDHEEEIKTIKANYDKEIMELKKVPTTNTNINNFKNFSIASIFQKNSK